LLVFDGVKHVPPERRTCPDGHAPPVCVFEPVLPCVFAPAPEVLPPDVVGTVQPTPPGGAGPVQFAGLPGTVLPGCVFEVEPEPEPVPVVEPVVVPLTDVVEVELVVDPVLPTDIVDCVPLRPVTGMIVCPPV